MVGSYITTSMPLALIFFITPCIRGLTEVVAAGFHAKSVCADGFGILCYYLIRNKGLAYAVCGDYRGNDVLRNMAVVYKQLFCVFGQAISAEGRVVVVVSYTRIEADAFDNRFCVKSSDLRIIIKFIKVRHTKCKICIRKHLNSFRYGRIHKADFNVLLESVLFKKISKCLRNLMKSS